MVRNMTRLLFGLGTGQEPTGWDQIPVYQMGRVYTIILPGGQPQTFDESLFDDTEHYDPHPDKHFRR